MIRKIFIYLFNVVFVVTAVLSQVYGEDLLPPMNGYASNFAQRRAGSIVNANIKITVSEEGLYKVSRAELLATGVSLDALVGSQIRLFNRTREVAISVSTDGLFGADDFIIFFADAYNSSFTESNVYWLGFGDNGLRMEEKSAAWISGAPDVSTYRHTSVHDPDQIYFSNFMPNDPSFDHWFTAFTSKTYNTNNTFSVWSDTWLATGTAIVELSLRGGDSYAGSPDHKTTVKIGGAVVGSLLFDGYDAFTGQISFSQTLLGAGSTFVELNQTQSGNANDRAYLKSFSLEFTRWLECLDNETISFEGKAGANNYFPGGFSTNNQFYVVNISNTVLPVLLKNFTINKHQDTYTVTFGCDEFVAAKYTVVESAGLRSADSIERVVFRDLADTTRQADYILICPYEFRVSAYRLLKHRHLEGFEVVVAPIEDIYNEFSYGIADAGAIKQFLGYTYHHWQTPEPQYVLLAGDGTYDPRGNLGDSGHNILPVHLGPSSWRWTAMDNWFVQINGQDQLIDMAAGRITVTSDAALGAVIDKIISFETAIVATNSWETRATLVADDDGAAVYKNASNNKVAAHLNGFFMTKVFLDDGYTAANARTTIINNFISGRFLFTFFGHGAVDFWAGEQVFRNIDVNTLANSIYPIVAMFTCNTGVFQDHNNECIGERLLGKNGGGAVGCFAPSILASQQYSEYVADGFTEELVSVGEVRLGDALMAGLFKLWSEGNASREELRSYLILGDPATLVKAE